MRGPWCSSPSPNSFSDCRMASSRGPNVETHTERDPSPEQLSLFPKSPQKRELGPERGGLVGAQHLCLHVWWARCCPQAAGLGLGLSAMSAGESELHWEKTVSPSVLRIHEEGTGRRATAAVSSTHSVFKFPPLHDWPGANRSHPLTSSVRGTMHPDFTRCQKRKWKRLLSTEPGTW